VPTLPNFTANGVLPPGDYAMTLDELEDSILVLGPGQPRDHPVWDAASDAPTALRRASSRSSLDQRHALTMATP
jgi:hypothetical protein